MKWGFVAGGTGGHIYPAVAIADYLRNNLPSHEVVFFTTDKQLDQSIISEAGYDFEIFKGSGFNQTGLIKKLQSLVSFCKIFFQSFRMFKNYDLDCVVGTGGYMSAPVLLAAKMSKKITATLEPNVVVGMSNKLVSHWVHKVFFAFEESRAFLNKANCVFSGNPIRQGILDIAPPQFDQKKLCIMIFGGSQGAMQINNLIIQALPKLVDFKDKIRFIHQTGQYGYEACQKAYQDSGYEHEVYEYIYDIPQAYMQASFIIARAGSSILEIAACGRPSILIPYPFAADSHQQENAKVMEKNKAAYVFNGKKIDQAQFVKGLVKLITNHEEKEKLKKGALSLRHEHASKTIVDSLCSEVSRA